MIFLSILISFFHPTFADGATKDEISTIEQRLNRSAFKDASMMKRYRPIEVQDQARIDGVRREVLDVIRLNDAEWFSKVVPNSPLPKETRNTIIKSIENIDVWVCPGKSCSDCGTDSPNGCVRSRTTVGSVGSIALIHPCLFSKGTVCAKTPASLHEWMEGIAGATAYAKITQSFKNDSLKKASEESSRVIRQTTKSVNELLTSCPGPYSSEAYQFLSRTQHISEPNSFVKKCGENYVDILKALRQKCPEISIFSELLAEFSERKLTSPIRIARCDSFCQVMTCHKKNTYPALARFGSVSTLLIVDGACEGESMKRISDFLRGTLPPEVARSSALNTCLAKLDPSPTRDSNSQSSILPDGPDIPLIQN